MREIWKQIDGWEGIYEVSNLSCVRSLDRKVPTCTKEGTQSTRISRGKVLKPTPDHLGYMRVDLNRRNPYRRTNRTLHRLVAMAFIPNPENKPDINHIDCNPSNNAISNLEWCTHQENMAHAFNNGRMVDLPHGKGEKAPSAKLKDDDVVEIKMRLAQGEQATSISQDYPVGSTTIQEIKAGRSWQHITLPHPEDQYHLAMGRKREKDG